MRHLIITINGQNFSLSLEEALELKLQLEKVFSTNICLDNPWHKLLDAEENYTYFDT